MPEVTREPKDSEKDSPEPSRFKAAEMLMKGMEIPLPDGYTFRDKDGHERKRVRVRWWDSEATTYRKAALLDELPKEFPDIPIPAHASVKPPTNKPIFFGHYWLTGKPIIQEPNIACLDYSAGKGGALCAYRWNGETTLNANQFCWVEPS